MGLIVFPGIKLSGGPIWPPVMARLFDGWSMKMNSTTAGGSKKANVFLVDDHAVLRRGLADLINGEANLRVGGEAATLGEAYSEIGKTRPDLVIVDVSLDGNDGVELTKELRHRWPQLIVLAYSMHDEELYAERLLRAGAKGYVMKRHPPEVLLDAIRQVLDGKVYLSDQMSGRLIGRLVNTSAPVTDGPAPIDKLSDRELEVFRLIGQGMPTVQIADKLCLSVKTIETYREHLKQKLKLKTGSELVRYAVEWTVKQT
jgi:DNA-binding NarL/FixJ family response regulator